MTVENSTAKSGPYAGAGLAGPFVVGFRFLDNSHLTVVQTSGSVETTLVLGVDFTATGAGESSGGTVTTAIAVPLGQTLTILRDVPVTQLTDYVQSDAFPAASHEDALDKLTMIAQQQAADVLRSLRVPEVGAELPLLPSAASRANKVIGFDSFGNPTVIIPIAGDASSVALSLANFQAAVADTTLVGNGDALIGVQSTLANSFPTSQHQVNEERVNVFRMLSAAQISDVGSGTAAVNVQSALQNAVSELSAIGKRPLFPGGIYLFDQLIFGTACVVEFDGNVVFKRTPSAASASHVLIQSNVAFMGDVVGLGGISGDPLQFSHFVEVSPSLADIDLVQFRQLKCSGYRGDGLYLGGTAAKKIKNARFGGVSASNMWRSAVSIVGATDVEFGFINGNNSCGYRALDIEPNAGVGQRTLRVRGGRVIGGRVQWAGDASIRIGNVDIDYWECDAALQTNSTPPSSLYDATTALQGGANFDRVRIGVANDSNATATCLPADYHSANGGILQLDHWVSANNAENTFKCHIRDDGLSEFRLGSGIFTPTTPDRYIAKGSAATRRKVGYLGVVSSTGGGFSFGTNNIFENLQIACAGTPAFVGLTKSQWNNCNVTACTFVVNACSDYQFKGGSFTYSGGTFDTGGSVRPGYDGLTLNGVTFSPEFAAPYSASVPINALAGRTAVIAATNNTPFTVQDPTDGYIGQWLSVRIKNLSGGALGTTTFGTHYRLATWTNAASGSYRAATFEYDGALWVEQSRTAVDISN